MRPIWGILVFIFVGLGLSLLLGKTWYWGFAGLLMLAVAFYLGSAFTRSRGPSLWVGPLQPDQRETTHQFQMEVQNRGPGSVTPKVKVTKVTDINGILLTIGFIEWEPHWRSVTVGERPLLEELDRRQAGVLVVDHNSKNWLGTYELDGSQRSLWPKGSAPDGGILLTLTVSCRPEGGKEEQFFGQTERTYHLWPDDAKPLGFACKRVRSPRWGLRRVTPSTSKHEQSTLTP